MIVANSRFVVPSANSDGGRPKGEPNVSQAEGP